MLTHSCDGIVLTTFECDELVTISLMHIQVLSYRDGLCVCNYYFQTFQVCFCLAGFLPELLQFLWGPKRDTLDIIGRKAGFIALPVTQP